MDLLTDRNLVAAARQANGLPQRHHHFNHLQGRLLPAQQVTLALAALLVLADIAVLPLGCLPHAAKAQSTSPSRPPDTR